MDRTVVGDKIEKNTGYRTGRMIAVTCLLAAGLALLLCVYQSGILFNCNVADMAADRFGIRRFGEFFVCFEAALLFCTAMGKERLFRLRYPIAALCFIVCVALEITGSSIGCFAGETEKNLLLGISRQIRSDEWAILTPMTWSQYMDPAGKFSYFNSVIGASSTDVFIEYGLPIYTPLMVFKPFLIGYLFLPVAKGMAFFWCGRLIALLMVSFEFGRLITKDNRLLSLVYSVMVAFSPCVQWWFAINGFVEMLIFSQLSIICLDRYLKDGDPWKRLIYTAVIGICAGGYALTMYPAWMIPLAYVLAGCIIWTFYVNYKQGTIKRIGRIDLLSIIFVAFLLTISALYVYDTSKETIATIANTVYPGHRTETGGLSLPGDLFGFIPSIWYSVRVVADYAGVNGNVCECAFFVCLFPAGYIFFFHRLLKKKKDALCTIMVIISAFLLLYSLIGLSETAATVSLLKYSKSGRTLVIWGFANVILLIRLIALYSEERDVSESCKGKSRRPTARLISCAVMGGMAILGIWAAYGSNEGYYNKYMIIIEALLFIPLYCLLCDPRRHANTLFAILMISVCMISCALANPVRMGVDDITENANVQMIRQVVEKDPEAIWIVEGDEFPGANTPLLAGARTINCTNIYPNLKRWRKIDPEGAHEVCYNRYAAIIRVNRENNDTGNLKFILYNGLAYAVNLTDEEMRSLGTKYILSKNELSGDSLKPVTTNGSYNVYEFR